MKAYIKILDTITEITNKINKAYAEELNKKINSKRNFIITECSTLASEAIIGSKEMRALANGTLSGMFGMLSGSEGGAINAIAQAVASSVTVEYRKINSQLKGGLKINFQPDTFVNILNLPQGHVSIKNGDLHWLEWMILRGDSPIVANFSYQPKAGAGRSGRGTMVSGGYFAIPPEYSGTRDDNFITRVLLSKEMEILLNGVVRKALL